MAMNSNSESKNNDCNLPMMVCVMLSGFWFYNTKHVVMLISARRIICLSHTCCIHVYMLAKSKNDPVMRWFLGMMTVHVQLILLACGAKTMNFIYTWLLCTTPNRKNRHIFCITFFIFPTNCMLSSIANDIYMMSVHICIYITDICTISFNAKFNRRCWDTST